MSVLFNLVVGLASCGICSTANGQGETTTNDIIISSCGKNETRAEYDQNLRLMSQLYKNKHPELSEAEVLAFSRKISNNVFMGMVRRFIFELDFGLTNSVGSIGASHQTELQYSKRFCRKGQDIAALRSDLRAVGLEEAFVANMARDARIEQYLNENFSNEVYASELDYTQSTNHIFRYNAMAIRTNEMTIARATEVLSAVRSGKDFAALAELHSLYGSSCTNIEEREVGGCVGEKIAVDFAEEPGLWQMLMAIPNGKCTEVVTISNGYAIYRVDSHIPPEESMSGEEAISLSRIFFRRAYIYPLQSKSELMADLNKEKRDDFLNARLERFAKSHEIRFPMGTLFFMKR